MDKYLNSLLQSVGELEVCLPSPRTPSKIELQLSLVVTVPVTHPSWTAFPSCFTPYIQPHVSQDQFSNNLLELKSLSQSLLLSNPKPRQYFISYHDPLRGCIGEKTMPNSE